MNKSLILAPLLAGLSLAATAQTQDPRGCPQLPADSDLIWQHRATGEADFCRALRADGGEAFGLYISPEPTFDPQRGNREETGRIDGREVYWYRAELAGQPDVQARETLVELRDGRVAHIWLQADTEAELQRLFGLTQALDFSPVPAAPATQIAVGQ